MITSSTPASETITFLFDATKDAPERLVRDLELLDTKAVQIFSAASVAMGFAGFSRAGLPDADRITYLLIAAAVLYIVTAGAAMVQVWPRTVWRMPFDTIAETHWDQPPDVIKQALVKNVGQACERNAPLGTLKRRCLVIAMGTAALEVLAIVGMLISARVV